MLFSGRQMSDCEGAALIIDAFPRLKTLLAQRGYDPDWFRRAWAERGIAACIPSKTNRKVPVPHDTALYRQRQKVENMFGKLKDWRRIHTRYNRCGHTSHLAVLREQVDHINTPRRCSSIIKATCTVGAFSNRASLVKPASSSLSGSWFSPRSARAAATSGPVGKARVLQGPQRADITRHAHGP